VMYTLLDSKETDFSSRCFCVARLIDLSPPRLTLLLRSSPTFLCILPIEVARSCSGGVVIRCVLPVLWMTSYLLTSQFAIRRWAEAQCTRSLGLGYKMCAVIPVAGQRTHGTTFSALKVTSQVATPGTVSAVYDCLIQSAWTVYCPV